MTKKYSKDYPELYTLFCGYFNQDWDEDYDTPESVIYGFIKNGSKKRLKNTIEEFKSLLAEEHTREEWLCIIYDDFGCFCNAEKDGMHPRKWLEKVLKQLEDELATAEEKERNLS